MATLVQFLAAGVKGAESGSATFVLRGTSSSAAALLYNDFEGTTQPGSNVITLDANGAAEVYADGYVDVQLRSSAGTLLRTVTLGNSAPLVEVQSSSFTGTDYDGNPANTLGEPITLKAILDKWILSAGAPDWQVMFGGVATDIESAIAGFSGMFINVKDPQYGATGDGVTDDTSAILAAFTAAAASGAIVFFPPGTYNVSTLNPAVSEVTVMGCGPDMSNIRGTSAGSFVLSFGDNTASAFKRLTGLKFTSSVSYTNMIVVEQDQRLSIDNCEFDLANVTGYGLSRIDADGDTHLTVDNCRFRISDAAGAIENLADDNETYITVSNCVLEVSSSFTGSIIKGPDFAVTNTKFDASAVTGATVYRHVDAVSAENAGRYRGRFSNNLFHDGGSSGFAFKLTGLGSNCQFSETGNTFLGFTAPAATAEKGHIYEITDAESGVPGNLCLGSRRGRTVYLDNDQTTFTASACLEAETVVIEHDAAANLIVSIPALIPGLSGRVVVNVSTGNGNNLIDFAGNTVSDLSRAVLYTETIEGEIETSEAAANQMVSAGYVTVARADGVFRSLITDVIGHEFAA